MKKQEEKILIVYKSKYGATKKYTELLQDEIACDVFDISKFDTISLEHYESVVFFGGIYASGIAGLNVLRKNYDNLKSRKVAIFAVGASPFDKKAFEEIKSHNLKNDLKSIPLFYGRGAWNEEKMTFKDRMLCKMLQKVISKKDPTTYEPWEKALMSAVGKECDWTDKKYLSSLIKFISSDTSNIAISEENQQ